MGFLPCCRGINVYGVNLSAAEIITAAENANRYLIMLNSLFQEIGFNLFTILGQRNISGVIGEIFSQFIAAGNSSLENNPHPDGRPDVLCIPNQEIRNYLQACYTIIDGKPMPIKFLLAPFKYGGLEIKCTIGDPVSRYKALLKKDIGIDDFYIGAPRVNYLQNLNWWAHHTKSSHLLGLYYDYAAVLDGVPQIMAGFFGLLDEDNWTQVSIGNVENKKTSNTSLNKSGKDIMKRQPVFIVDDQIYIAALRKIGVSV